MKITYAYIQISIHLYINISKYDTQHILETFDIKDTPPIYMYIYFLYPDINLSTHQYVHM